MRFVTKNSFVYEQLRKNIISGDIKPGERLIINKIAKRYGISGIPIREAITKLTTEGLVTHVPHVGARVTTINYRELEENYMIRSALEGLATRSATQHLAKSDFAKLEKNLRLMREVVASKKFSKVGVINKQFHRTIYRACPYPKLFKMIFDLWDNIDRIQSVFALVPSSAKSSIKEHEEILRALRKKDGYLAQSLVEKQKQRAWRDLESYLKYAYPAAEPKESAAK